VKSSTRSRKSLLSRASLRVALFVALAWGVPLVGVNMIVELAKHWAVRAEADIGGFGVGSDLTWNAQAFLTYGSTVAGYDAFASAGYRALYWDYKDGGFEWDVTMSGPLLGAGVRFLIS
jgi:hypothetical protein